MRVAAWRRKTRPLLDHITTPAIAVRPEWALWARQPFGVVDPLLMRAAYDSIGRDDRLGSMIPHELKDLGCNSQICPDVALLGDPTLECTGLSPSAFTIPTAALLALVSSGP